MASNRKSRVRNEVVRCNNCGEDYSVTYKRCPFCDESAARNARTGSGKRLRNTRGGGYGGGWSPLRVVTTLLSVALIVSAAYIVITILGPLIALGGQSPPGEDITPALPSGAEIPLPPDESEPPVSSESPPPPASSPPSAPPTQPAVRQAERFTLDSSDFTLTRSGETYRFKVSFDPAGTSGEVSWASSSPQIVSVSSDGVVTGLARGNSTITATLEGGYTQTCIVRCGWSESASSGGESSASAPAGEISLSHTDVTLRREGEAFTLRVGGTDSTPNWSSSNSSVASVSSTGKVTAVGAGSATVTATVGGQTLKCIVRCNF